MSAQASAQTPRPAKPLRIAILGNNSWAPMEGLRQGLRDLGYVEGQNLQIETRWAEGWDARYPALVKELVGLNLDAIVTWGTPATLAAKSGASSTPVIMAAVGDPVGVGAVPSLDRPGGNVTGLSSVTGQMEEKRLELVKELVPQMAKVGVLANTENPAVRSALKRLTTAATVAGVKVDVFEASAADSVDHMFDLLSEARPDAVTVFADPTMTPHQSRIIEFMSRNRIPAAYPERNWAEAGGLISFAPSYYELFRRVATYIDKIARGAKPGDLAVEVPTKFEFVVNQELHKRSGL